MNVKCASCKSIIKNWEHAWYKGSDRYCNGKCLTDSLKQKGDWTALREKHLREQNLLV